MRVQNNQLHMLVKKDKEYAVYQVIKNTKEGLIKL